MCVGDWKTFITVVRGPSESLDATSERRMKKLGNIDQLSLDVG